jgi:hypothetical protein
VEIPNLTWQTSFKNLLGRFRWQFQLGFVRCFFGSDTFGMPAGTGARNRIPPVGACQTAKLVFDFDQAPARAMGALDKIFRLHLALRWQALIANDQRLIFSSFDIGLPSAIIGAKVGRVHTAAAVALGEPGPQCLGFLRRKSRLRVFNTSSLHCLCGRITPRSESRLRQGVDS